MLAKRLPTMMPQLEPAAALEVRAFHSVAGSLPPGARSSPYGLTRRAGRRAWISANAMRCLCTWLPRARRRSR